MYHITDNFNLKKLKNSKRHFKINIKRLKKSQRIHLFDAKFIICIMQSLQKKVFVLSLNKHLDKDFAESQEKIYNERKI